MPPSPIVSPLDGHVAGDWDRFTIADITALVAIDIGGRFRHKNSPEARVFDPLARASIEPSKRQGVGSHRSKYRASVWRPGKLGASVSQPLAYMPFNDSAATNLFDPPSSFQRVRLVTSPCPTGPLVMTSLIRPRSHVIRSRPKKKSVTQALIALGSKRRIIYISNNSASVEGRSLRDRRGL
jgi:hypothetical protein